MKTKILIADDQRLFAEGLKFVIESRAKDLDVIDMAGNGKEAVAKTENRRPDIVLMDVRMPVMDGVEATRLIHERFPAVKILILTTFDDDEYVKFSIQNGATGYILKNRPPAELINAIRAVRDGILQIDPAVSGKLFGFSRHAEDDASEIVQRLRTLTTREREVLGLLVKAERVDVIAEKLAIAEQTVRNHVNSIYSKLDIHTRIEIVRYIEPIRAFLKNVP